MVQTDISQLTAETSEWRHILRNYKQEFQDGKKALLEVCRNSLSKDQLQNVEHFHNQFHIQLINIHDLKQNIKQHERKIDNAENISEEVYSEHEQLLSEFISLETVLQELRADFKNFISQISC
ncbi:MAG: hypothetical protein C4329_01870 [Chitinophagaceae bacterium]